MGFLSNKIWVRIFLGHPVCNLRHLFLVVVEKAFDLFLQSRLCCHNKLECFVISRCYVVFISTQVHHVYNNIDDLSLKVRVENLVSSKKLEQTIKVRAPVEDVTVVEAPEIVVKDTLVWFNVSAKGNADTICWKVSLWR